MKDTHIFYSLDTSDIQNVAQDSVGRNLSESEIKKVVSEVEKRIAWYDIIDDAITEVIRNSRLGNFHQ